MQSKRWGTTVCVKVLIALYLIGHVKRIVRMVMVTQRLHMH